MSPVILRVLLLGTWCAVCGSLSDPTSNGADGAEGSTVCVLSTPGAKPLESFYWAVAAEEKKATALWSTAFPCPVGADCAASAEPSGRLTSTDLGTCER
jgi:hypothetical protein